MTRVDSKVLSVDQPASVTAPTSFYIPTLDGLRAIAFFCVFLAHTNGPTFGRFVPAAFGVTLFFFLSGYLITTLLRGEAKKTGTIVLKNFYTRRALRIFVPMYITFCVAEMMGWLKYHDWHLNKQGLFSVLLYFYNYSRMFQPVPLLPRGFEVTWSLGVEEHFYLLFPLCYSIMLRKTVSRETQVKLLIGLCAIGLCWRTYVSYHHFPDQWTYFATDCRFDSILWGSLLAIGVNPIYDSPPRLLKRYGGALAVVAVAVLAGSMMIGAWHHIDKEAYVRYSDTFRNTFQGICLYFIFHFAITSSRHWTVRWLENPALRYVGWLSYSLYLIHASILSLFDNFWPKHVGHEPVSLHPLICVRVLHASTRRAAIAETSCTLSPRRTVSISDHPKRRCITKGRK